MVHLSAPVSPFEAGAPCVLVVNSGSERGEHHDLLRLWLHLCTAHRNDGLAAHQLTVELSEDMMSHYGGKAGKQGTLDMQQRIHSLRRVIGELQRSAEKRNTELTKTRYLARKLYGYAAWLITTGKRDHELEELLDEMTCELHLYAEPPFSTVSHHPQQRGEHQWQG